MVRMFIMSRENTAGIVFKICSILALTGCLSTESVQVDFKTDPYVLRGNWSGTMKGNSPDMTFQFSATYIDESHYRVDGIVRTTDENSLKSIQGEVYGNKVEYLRAQSTLRPSEELFIANIVATSGEVVQQLCVQSSGTRDSVAGISYFGFLAPPNSFEIIEGLPICREDRATQQITLSKSSM